MRRKNNKSLQKNLREGFNNLFLEENRLKLVLILFFFAFIYMFMFTNQVPFFWDDHQFHKHYFEQNTIDLATEMFSLVTYTLDSSPRTGYALFFKAIFFIDGYNIFLFRAAKALVFGLLIASLFYFCNKYLKDTKLSVLYTFFIMFSYSLFIHTLVYDEPYIISELFKVLALYLFLKDYTGESSVKNQVIIGILGLLAVRTYLPGYSVPIIISLFILFNKFKHVKRYILLLIFLFSTTIPLSSAGGAINFIQIKKFLFNDIFYYISSPIINLSGIYYKPFLSVITFFGFWLFILAVMVLILRKYLKKYSFFRIKKTNDSLLITFALAWGISEIPLWFNLPEHAVRYATSLLIPFMLLYFVVIKKALANFRNRRKVKKGVFVIIILFIFLACLTNLAYTTTFRAGWGSAFIGMEKTTDYIEETRSNNSIILYYSHSTAYEYLPVEIEKPRNGKGAYYLINEGVNYMKVSNIDKFSDENLQNLSKEYSEVYVIKRVTGIKKTPMPDINFDNYNILEEQVIIKGESGALFEQIMSLIPMYEPHSFFVYKVK